MMLMPTFLNNHAGRDLREFGSTAGHSLPGPDDIVRVELSNGIVLLFRENFSSPSVVINGYLSAGGISDPNDKLGLADYTSSMLMRGTLTRSFQEIYDLLESAGASLGFEGGIHTSSFWGRALAEDIELLIQILADTLRNPDFPDGQVEKLRIQLLTNLAIRDQTTGDMASLAFDRIIFANHPYSRPEDGYPETIQQITCNDLHHFHRDNYTPQGMTITIVGAVANAIVLEQINHYLGDWIDENAHALPSLPELTLLKETTKIYIPIEGKSQADLVIGTVGPTRKSPDYLPALLGNSVLGQFGLMGRIGNSVREKAGLAYYAQSTMSGGVGPGQWTVSAGVAPENIDRAIKLIQEEISRFVNEPVSEEELEDSKANFIGRLPLSLESNGGVASALINLERYNLGLDYYRKYAEMINSITSDQILEVAQKYLNPECLAIAISGPPSNK